MEFPDEELEITAQAAFGADLTAAPSTWLFTDLSDRALNTPITTQVGTAAGATTTQTSTGSINLRNDDGWLTPKHPSSSYWPDVDTGTPFWIGIRTRTAPYVTDPFTRTTTNSWGAAPNGLTWSVSPPTAFATTGTTGTLTHTVVDTARAARLNLTLRDCDATYDASVSKMSAGIANSIGVIARHNVAGGLRFIWATTEFMVGGGIQAKIWVYANGAYTPIGQQVIPGLTYTVGTKIRSRVEIVGGRIRVKAWLAAGTEPALWGLTVYDFTVKDAGLLGLDSCVFAGSTITFPLVFTVDNFSTHQPVYPRIEGYIADVRPTFLPSGATTWSDVTIDVGGISTRLEKAESPAYSPFRRSIQLAGIPPLAYWPLEDAEGSRYASSAFPGGPKMIVEGPAVFAFATGVPEDQYLSRYGTKPMVSLAAGARISAAVPASATTSQWEVAFTNQMFAPEVPGTPDIRVVQWATPAGTWNRWAFVALGSYGYRVVAYNDDLGTSTTVLTTGAFAYRTQAVYEIEATQAGANIVVDLRIDAGLPTTGVVAGTLGAVTQVIGNPDKANTTASVTPSGLRFILGHLRVIDDVLAPGIPFYYDPVLDKVFDAAVAWYREPAHMRVARLCAEERVPCFIDGAPTVESGMTLLNSQQDGTFGDLRDAAVAAESGGLLVEEAYGYRYVPRSARYNQPVDLSIDLATYARSGDTSSGDVLVPQLDPRTPTVWTVQRTNGATGTYAAPTETLKRRGTIAAQATLDVLLDEDTDDHAGWRTHLSVDARDAYYPAVPVDLAANPSLIDAWLGCGVGSRIQRVNQPVVAGVDTIDQVADGIGETFGPRMWQATVNASPGGVWDVFTPDDPILGWVESDETILTAGVNTTAVTWTVTVVGALWSTNPADYPVDLRVAGERVRLDSVSGGASPQTFHVTRSRNGVVKTHPAAEPISLWTTPILAL